MPTYEYRCERCAHTVEVVQSFADAPLTTCESCGGTLRKVFAPVGIVFKGSGFYKNDSRSSSSSRRTPPGDAGSGSESKDPASSSGSKDGAKDGTKDGGRDGAKASSSGAPDAGSSTAPPASSDKGKGTGTKGAAATTSAKD